MSVTTLYTLKPHNESDLKKMLEHVYGISQDWITVSMSEDQLATIEIETEMDIDSRIAVNIKNDGMLAEFSLFPAVNKGKALDNDAVERYLIKEKGLTQELFNWDSIKHAVQYFTSGYIVENVIVSEGVEAEHGQDAWIHLHFELEDKKPKEMEDGSVDFREINHIVTVEENQLLISYHQETNGKDGLKVTGERILARKGKKLVIHKGKNVFFDEGRSAFCAQEAGHVIYEQNRISVNPIYAVNGDVDFAVGNIKFDGTVSVTGDVLSGFEIEAKNIVIWGIVRDAVLKAKNDINVKVGVKSTGKCILEAGRDIITGFMENTTATAGGSINIKNYCFNSKLFCDGHIEVYSGDGIISGGEIHAFSYVRARKFGLEQGSAFKVFLGVKHNLNDQLESIMADKEKLERILKDTDEKIKKMVKLNPDVKKQPKLKQIITSRNLLYKKYQTIDEKTEQLIKTSMHPMPYLRADENIYDGITMVFYGTSKTVTDETGPAKFIFNKGSGRIEKLKPDAPIEDAEITEVSLDE